MFDVFRATFHPDRETIQTEAEPCSVSFDEAQLNQLLMYWGGTTFNQGIYRIITSQTIPHWSSLITKFFPDFINRTTCFAVDWLGRIFALDTARLENGRPGVIMFEPGTGDALEIPCDIETFHEHELIQYQEEALAASFYKQWLQSGGAAPKITQCIGYKKPLFLGGSDTLDNLELVDLDVYWTIMGQLIQKTRGLPLGTKIDKITIN